MIKVNFSALPAWRRVIAILGFAVFFLLVSAVTAQEMSIWSSASKTPNSSTAQVYELHWMHGSARYVTATDLSKFRFWYSDVAPLIGIPFLIAFFCMVSVSDLLRAAREA